MQTPKTAERGKAVRGEDLPLGQRGGTADVGSAQDARPSNDQYYLLCGPFASFKPVVERAARHAQATL